MSELRRFPDWQRRFDDFVRARFTRAFAWGSNDCALFAADDVEALTGARLLPELRGLGARESIRLLRSEGGLAGLATRALGAPALPTLARPGDVVLLRVGRRECLGVCNGQTALAPGRRGVEAGPMTVTLAAWRVG